MYDSRPADAVSRPTACPYCNGKIIGTLAKVISVTSVWRCRECEQTWTIAGLAASSRRTNRPA